MILVTGGTGLVGAHLLFDLLQKEDKVCAIKRSHSSLNQIEKIFSFYSSDPISLLAKIEWREAELLDYFSLEESLKGITQVYHCAAMVSFKKKDKQKMMTANIEGTKNLVNACLYHKIQKLVHVSSIAALGRAEAGESASEKTPWKDSDKDSPYSISKYQSEMEVWRGIAEGLNAVIVNPSVILGPGDWSKGSPSFFNMMAKGMKYYSHGMNGYVYVRDVTRAMIELMESDINGERFVLNGEDLTYLEFFNMMAKSLNKPFPSIEAKAWMMNLAWRGAYIKGLITRKTPELTKSTARSFMSSYSYSSEKIEKSISFEFTALQKAIMLIGDCHLKDKNVL
ncbi:NAD-dependent epimerase/dehydratase family protein [Lentimicrobium sp. S6]|uniref:NAD-dependent epimerase/dehydratase family protein n=1 Tax=Lentimicrobium sp. S6 TaxID=2735872 RepID=UPI0015529E2A|nr:NAD-dependent epimerase/dehydratase family protein [Lentimicrobium sp. S6]NPD46408.1 NAD-dependent epimerase/dehydratase family protein [Lentimicrobium sp. S6]